MARRKNQPHVVQAKCYLSERLREIRMELFGDRGGSEMARRLGIPVRTWYNYESGVTVPAEVLLRFMEMTGVETRWLLHGEGSKFRHAAAAELISDGDPSSIADLLRSALDRLERTQGLTSEDVRPKAIRSGAVPSPGVNGRSEQSNEQAYRAWREALEEGRIVKVSGAAMAPIVAEDAEVAYAVDEETPEALDGALVVAWLGEEPIVRWFRRSGGFGLLRAENPDHTPGMQLLEMKNGGPRARVRRVLWISTPH
jgi:transcriptional regulator with XRE-family HTH domain